MVKKENGRKATYPYEPDCAVPSGKCSKKPSFGLEEDQEQ